MPICGLLKWYLKHYTLGTQYRTCAILSCRGVPINSAWIFEHLPLSAASNPLCRYSFLCLQSLPVSSFKPSPKSRTASLSQTQVQSSENPFKCYWMLIASFPPSPSPNSIFKTKVICVSECGDSYHAALVYVCFNVPPNINSDESDHKNWWTLGCVRSDVGAFLLNRRWSVINDMFPLCSGETTNFTPTWELTFPLLTSEDAPQFMGCNRAQTAAGTPVI